MTREYEIKHRKLEIRQELETTENMTESRLAEIDAELKGLEREEEELAGASARLEAVRSGSAATRTVATYAPGARSGGAVGVGLPTTREAQGMILGREQRMVDRFPNSQNLSLGKYLRGIITGDWENASAEA